MFRDPGLLVLISLLWPRLRYVKILVSTLFLWRVRVMCFLTLSPPFSAVFDSNVLLIITTSDPQIGPFKDCLPKYNALRQLYGTTRGCASLRELGCSKQRLTLCRALQHIVRHREEFLKRLLSFRSLNVVVRNKVYGWDNGSYLTSTSR